MSTAPAPTHAAAPPAMPREVVVISHSNLFYWWPVWAVGYLMATITLFNNELMVTVPTKTLLAPRATGVLTYEVGRDKKEPKTLDGEDAYIAPDKSVTFEKPYVHMTTKKSLGVVYAIVLLLIITI